MGEPTLGESVQNHRTQNKEGHRTLGWQDDSARSLACRWQKSRDRRMSFCAQAIQVRETIPSTGAMVEAELKMMLLPRVPHRSWWLSLSCVSQHCKPDITASAQSWPGRC